MKGEKIYEARAKEKEVYKVTLNGGRKPITKRHYALKVYDGDTELTKEQVNESYEHDPFTRRQNELIKTVEGSERIQREYSILKDLQTTAFITSFLYSQIDERYKNGKKQFPLVDFFRQLSKESEIRPLYGKFCSGPKLKNEVNFKLLNINKWDRVNWLKNHGLIKVEES